MYLNDTSITQILQCHQIFSLPKAVQIPPAEGQCGEVLVNCCQQLLCSGQPQWNVTNVKILHVIATLQIFSDISLTLTNQKMVNRKKRSFLSQQTLADQKQFFPTQGKTLPVDAKVSIAKNSPSSIFVCSPPFTMGTDFPAWIWQRPMLCPFKFLMLLTAKTAKSNKNHQKVF